MQIKSNQSKAKQSKAKQSKATVRVECKKHADDAYAGVVMTDPVIALDGHSYERSAIERWFQQGQGSLVRSLSVQPVHSV